MKLRKTELVSCRALERLGSRDVLLAVGEHWVSNGHVLVHRTMLRDQPADAQPHDVPPKKVVGFDLTQEIGGWGSMFKVTSAAYWFEPRFNHGEKRWWSSGVGVRFDSDDGTPATYLQKDYVELLWPWIVRSEGVAGQPREVELRAEGGETPLVIAEASTKGGYWPIAVVMPMRVPLDAIVPAERSVP